MYKGTLCKVELAKMLGLGQYYSECVVVEWHISEILKQEWYTSHVYEFNADITVTLELEDLSKDNLDIKLSDLDKDEDSKVCIKQCEDLLWERAADQYLEKIKNLVETIKV